MVRLAGIPITLCNAAGWWARSDRYPSGDWKDTVSITIRKPSSVFLSHDHFVRQGFYSKLNAGTAFESKQDDLSDIYKKIDLKSLSLLVWKVEKLWFFAGTGAGKTTFANACLEFIPHHLRCISIEDTDEAKFKFHENHVKLLSRRRENKVVTSATLLRSDSVWTRQDFNNRNSWRWGMGFSERGKLRPCRKHNNSARNESCRCCIRYCAAVLYESECQNLPYNVLLWRVLSNIDVIMSIKYLDEGRCSFCLRYLLSFGWFRKVF